VKNGDPARIAGALAGMLGSLLGHLEEAGHVNRAADVLEAHPRLEYSGFVDRLITIAGGYRVYIWASEINGVGAAPTQDLRRRLREEGISGHVQEVWTDGRRKQAGFSVLKSAMQDGTLILPRDPDLTRELSHLDYERTPAGSLRIAARQGADDDRAMSLLQAASCIKAAGQPGRHRLACHVRPRHHRLRHRDAAQAEAGGVLDIVFPQRRRCRTRQEPAW
jgi:hypothetical protein